MTDKIKALQPKKTIKSLTFYPNGIVLAFDENGEQMVDIQKIGWMEAYFDRLQEMGYNPTEIGVIRARLNDGAWKDVILSLTADGHWVIDFKPI
jgi:hypothetical protein